MATSDPSYPDKSYPNANYPQQQPYPQAYCPPPQYPPPAQQYPQQPQQPYPGQVAYVGQPNPGYSTPSNGTPQQQQQQTVVINAATPTVVTQYPHLVQSYSGHIAFACVVFWFCGWLFGAIAFFLALGAQNTQHGDPVAARRLGRASLGVSIAGVVVGVAVIIAISVSLSQAASSTKSRSRCCNYYGNCYYC